MATNNRVRVDVEDAVATVSLTRPDKHNGMDFAMLDGVLDAIAQLSRRRDLRAVIVRGDGPSFCAGLDVKAVMGAPTRAVRGYTQLYWPTRNRFQTWSMGWRELPVPVIAAIHGNCFGAGMQLALGADIRICTPDAQLSVMESKWGLVPDMGGAALLRELVRLDVAKELTLTGRVVSGTDAHALGLVTHVSADPLAHAQALVEEIATRSPDAVAAAKFLLQEAWDGDEDEALSAERRRQRQVMGKRNQRLAVKRQLEDKDLPYAEVAVRR